MKDFWYWRKKLSPLIMLIMIIALPFVGHLVWARVAFWIIWTLLPCGVKYFQKGEGYVIRQSFGIAMILANLTI